MDLFHRPRSSQVSLASSHRRHVLTPLGLVSEAFRGRNTSRFPTCSSSSPWSSHASLSAVEGASTFGCENSRNHRVANASFSGTCHTRVERTALPILHPAFTRWSSLCIQNKRAFTQHWRERLKGLWNDCGVTATVTLGRSFERSIIFVVL